MIGWQDSPIDIGCYYTTGLDAVDWNLQLAAAPFKVDGTAVTFHQQGNSAVFLLEFE